MFSTGRPFTGLTDMTDIWDDLHRHHAATKSVTMAALFANAKPLKKR